MWVHIDWAVGDGTVPLFIALNKGKTRANGYACQELNDIQVNKPSRTLS